MRRLSFAEFLLSLSAASLFGGIAQAAPSADVYGAPPELANVAISPDGNFLAMTVPQGDTGGVRITKIGGASCAFSGGKVKIRDLFWANSQRLIVGVSFTNVGDKATQDPRYTDEIYRYISVNASCQDTKELLADYKDYGRITGFDFIGRAADGQHLLFAALNLKAPNHYVDSHMKDIQLTSLDVYSVDAATGKSERYEAGTPRTAAWFADASGKLPMRIEKDAKSGQRTVYARIGGSSDWQLVYDTDTVTDDSRALGFLGMGNKPDTAYVLTRNGGDKEAIYEFDLKAKALGRLVFQDAKVDAEDLVFDAYSQQAVGVSYTQDHSTAEYFDRDYAQMQADLAATFPGEQVLIVSVSADRKKYVAFVEGAQNPGGTYQFVDMTIPDMSKIGSRYSAINASDIGSVKSFSYQARDGLTIPAYLTLPRGSSGKNMSLVVMPHGGPARRDDGGFDPWAQFLASRGYAVLQPQYRGSSGYGARFQEAGHFKWGLEMQNDISDGVAYLVGNGTADASKVCIFGWSYGGYAAMAGLAFTPNLYKCGVAGAGISDLLLLIGDIRRENPSVYLAGDEWRDYLGDPTSDRDRLIATSPVRHVDQIKAPLLLIHGKDDTRVPFRQSEVMANALKAAGKPVEFVVLEHGDHNLTSAETSKRVLRELEAFLAKYLR